MYQPRLGCGATKNFGMALILGVALTVASGTAIGQDKLLPPPYQMAGTNHVLIGVVWDEATIRKALPPGITPVKEMTGAINIYQAEKGYVIGPYQSAYFWVDVEGFDSPEGIKGRWILAGVYGPQEKTPAALKEFYGFPVRIGTSRFEPTPEGKRAIGTVNGQDFITAKIKSVPGACELATARVNYPALSEKTKQVVINEIPFVGEFCKAEPVSVEVTAPAGDAFSAYKIAKVVWAAEFKNGSFSFTYPQPAKK
jgi:hypothetical protein